MSLLPVDDALAKILRGVKPLNAEDVPLNNSAGRVLATALRAERAQPPFAASAMDGYAVRFDDIAKVPTVLNVVGEAPAGHGYTGRVRKGDAVRIFTGAPVPKGADTIVIQEDTETAEAGFVTILEKPKNGQFVRGAGLDFKKGEAVLPKGTLLGAREIGLAAAMNHERVFVVRKPSVALLATGDELVAPGASPRDDQIISSNSLALAAMISSFGAEPVDLGLVPDKVARIEDAIDRAQGADVLVTIGGASVGDHDLVQEAMTAKGVKQGFWKIAMRPGKPLMFGKREDQRIIGLPGNPVSAMVCARLFVMPLLFALLGRDAEDTLANAQLGARLGANDHRQDYVRATLKHRKDGMLIATPFKRQDSSMQRVFRDAHCLIVRPPLAPAAAKGDPCKIVVLDF